MEAVDTPKVDHAHTYNRLLGSLYLTWRGTSVLVYGSGTWESRRAYEQPSVAGGLWLLMTLESAWSTARIVRRSRVDRSTVWADTAASAALAALFPRARPDVEGDLWHDWGTAQGLYQVEAMPFVVTGWAERVALLALFCAGHVLGAAAGRGERPRWADLARPNAMLAFRMLLTGLFADFVHANVGHLDTAQAEAMDAAARDAQDRARSRHRRYLQDSALQVLEAVSAAVDPAEPTLRKAATREAARLRRLLLPEASGGSSGIDSVVEEAAASGIDVEVVLGNVPADLPDTVVEAIRTAVADACAPLGTGEPRRVVLFVDVVDDALLATLRGSGVRHDLRLAL